MAVLTRGENVMLRLDPVEPLGAFPQTYNHFISFVIHRNQSLSRFRLTCANQDCTAEEVNLAPLYCLISHPRIVGQSARDMAASARCHSSFCPAVCNSLSFSS